jgi:CheY-like chemotaxis protein
LLLRRAGHQVFEARDGEDTLTACHREMFDILFCDLFLPGIGGLQVIREVRRDFPAVKIVAISGGGGRGYVEHLYAARMLGAEAAIHKPFGPKALLQALEKVLPSFADVGSFTL